jgi:hypothetical protein
LNHQKTSCQVQVKDKRAKHTGFALRLSVLRWHIRPFAFGFSASLRLRGATGFLRVSQWLRVSVVGFGFALEIGEHVAANLIRKLIKSIE